jgi:hypothetical protein
MWLLFDVQPQLDELMLLLFDVQPQLDELMWLLVDAGCSTWQAQYSH